MKGMQILTLTANHKKNCNHQILCPILSGLNSTQADCAIVIPSGNANQLLLNALSNKPNSAAYHVGVLCNDPFVHETAFFSDLYALGVRTIINWPSSIFLEQSFKRAMATIGIHPESEFEFLAKGIAAGFQAQAFIQSLEQGKQAIAQGIKSLIIHPGLQGELTEKVQYSIFDSLQFMIDALLGIDPDLNIYIYQHTEQQLHAYQQRYRAKTSLISGFVVYGEPV
jgi:predicted TIM-barrel enzyme